VRSKVSWPEMRITWSMAMRRGNTPVRTNTTLGERRPACGRGYLACETGIRI